MSFPIAKYILFVSSQISKDFTLVFLFISIDEATYNLVKSIKEILFKNAPISPF